MLHDPARNFGHTGHPFQVIYTLTRPKLGSVVGFALAVRLISVPEVLAQSFRSWCPDHGVRVLDRSGKGVESSKWTRSLTRDRSTDSHPMIRNAHDLDRERTSIRCGGSTLSRTLESDGPCGIGIVHFPPVRMHMDSVRFRTWLNVCGFFDLLVFPLMVLSFIFGRYPPPRSCRRVTMGS